MVKFIFKCWSNYGEVRRLPRADQVKYWSNKISLSLSLSLSLFLSLSLSLLGSARRPAVSRRPRKPGIQCQARIYII